MTIQKDSKCKENQDGVEDINKEEEEDPKKECVRFCIDAEEVLDDKEREHLQRDAKKFESIVDRLFKENQSEE